MKSTGDLPVIDGLLWSYDHLAKSLALETAASPTLRHGGERLSATAAVEVDSAAGYATSIAWSRAAAWER